MTCTVFSYAGTVTIGFATDAALVPDVRELVEATVTELRSLVDMSRERSAVMNEETYTQVMLV